MCIALNEEGTACRHRASSKIQLPTLRRVESLLQIFVALSELDTVAMLQIKYQIFLHREMLRCLERPGLTKI